ncbi:hypothetical protein PN456_11175 [Nodularia spumigena CS-586/05]|uniref:hypothetical protein n=1 Tax=Nodularia spumigena TaxID=70799 RepID=UPI00232D2931|nr:hypothetical protein [Nodularia spumigena]MDB9344161.1 hypothetical protein [Nodularia spumigena CS-588/06]MDB9369512.1 hypothetical protein [Nodularia spumigena CS-586/05]
MLGLISSQRIALISQNRVAPYMKDGAKGFQERFSNIKAQAYQDYQSALNQL